MFIPAQSLSPVKSPEQYFITCRGKLFFDDGVIFNAQTMMDLSLTICHEHYLGELNGLTCFVAEVEQTDFLAAKTVRLRDLLLQLEPWIFNLCGRALQVITWYRDHRFCGRCGAKTTQSLLERFFECESCSLRYYPRISPCVIGLITKGDKCLLARGNRLPEGMFSALAGFIEPGENAEEAFQREVMEEVGLWVENIRYVRSQPWPFPGQLMFGFLADFKRGEIRVDGVEILEADWFRFDDLPMVPPPETISGVLIRDFVASCQQP